MRRHGSDLLLALLLGLALGRWLLPAAADRAPVAPETSRRSEQPPSVSRAAAAPGRAAILPEAVPAEMQTADGRSGLGFDAPARLASLPAFLDELARRAESGDGAALEELAHWAMYCDRSKGAAAMQRYGGPNALDLADPEVHQWFADVVPICAQWLQRHDWLQALQKSAAVDRKAEAGQAPDPRAPRTFPALLLARARDAGDWVARIHGNDPALRPDCPAGSASGCRADFQRAQLAAALASGDPRVIAIIGELGYRMGLSTLHSRYFPFDTAIRDALWNLAACQLGLPCGPEHRSVQLACLAGACGYRDYASYAYDQRLTPAGRRFVDGSLPSLVAILRAGDLDALMR